MGSFTVALRVTVTASTPATVGVMVTLPVAVVSGAEMVSVCCSPAAMVADVGLAVKPPVVAMPTVMLAVPGLLSVRVFVAPGLTRPKFSAPSVAPVTLRAGPSVAASTPVKLRSSILTLARYIA